MTAKPEHGLHYEVEYRFPEQCNYWNVHGGSMPIMYVKREDAQAFIDNLEPLAESRELRVVRVARDVVSVTEEVKAV